jgi:hypothetical protein
MQEKLFLRDFLTPLGNFQHFSNFYDNLLFNEIWQRRYEISFRFKSSWHRRFVAALIVFWRLAESDVQSRVWTYHSGDILVLTRLMWFPLGIGVGTKVCGKHEYTSLSTIQRKGRRNKSILKLGVTSQLENG